MLTTPRLLLRPVEPDDVPAHRRLWTDPEVRRHLGGPVPPETVRIRERGCVGAPGERFVEWGQPQVLHRFP
ncbi:hypothetical protein ABZ723_05820 [Streptomyces sp. NPDC006700]|uniref:GNAT family N-acetyltransferase n=1 Tax=unclassified Streptomyces TaxID=2593676 RepID=UPI0033E25202